MNDLSTCSQVEKRVNWEISLLPTPSSRTYMDGSIVSQKSRQFHDISFFIALVLFVNLFFNAKIAQKRMSISYVLSA